VNNFQTDKNRFAFAEESLKTMLRVNTLQGHLFLDAGSGSGLFLWRPLGLVQPGSTPLTTIPGVLPALRNSSGASFPNICHGPWNRALCWIKSILPDSENMMSSIPGAFCTTQGLCGRLWITFLLWSPEADSSLSLSITTKGR